MTHRDDSMACRVTAIRHELAPSEAAVAELDAALSVPESVVPQP